MTKNKPYSKGNAPRPVRLGGQYTKRKGSEFFSVRGTVKSKEGAEATLGYSTTQSKRKSPYVSTRHRNKNLHASGKLPLGGGVKLRGSIDRFSDKGSYQVDAPDFQGSGDFGGKPMYTYRAGIDAPMLGGTGSLDSSHTPGDRSIMARYNLTFNRGGKVKKRKNKKKK